MRAWARCKKSEFEMVQSFDTQKRLHDTFNGRVCVRMVGAGDMRGWAMAKSSENYISTCRTDETKRYTITHLI